MPGERIPSQQFFDVVSLAKTSPFVTPPSRSLKIFLVENHNDTLTYLSSYLRACGHEVECARDMASALESLEGRRIDVLICDIGLPDGDGWQLMERVRKSGGPIPFGIAISGYSLKADIERSLSAGYRHHLVKPFVPDDLDVLLREAAGGEPD